jgi:GTP-binding protein
MKFIDQIEILIKAGDGGPGLVAFSSDKGRTKMGADGGDGGMGGSVILAAAPQLNTLSSLRFRQLYTAENGSRGGSNNKTGRSGEDLVIPVPIGTIAVDKSTRKIIAEIVEPGQQVVVARGGKRGLGNARFLSPRHQAPEEHTTGTPGEQFELDLELKLVADVGFAGLPNAGKSTLLSRISSARPKIADYPFTTLVPHLGVVDLNQNEVDEFGASFVAADIPGLIEGASQGKGLGHAFLRHIERTKVITYVLDASEYAEMAPVDSFHMLYQELEAFDPQLVAKRSCIILTKLDQVGPDFDFNKLQSELSTPERPVIAVSSLTGQGLSEMKRKLYEIVQSLKQHVEINEPKNDSKSKYQMVTETVELPI